MLRRDAPREAFSLGDPFVGSRCEGSATDRPAAVASGSLGYWPPKSDVSDELRNEPSGA
jgi:hypothetical protein